MTRRLRRSSYPLSENLLLSPLRRIRGRRLWLPSHAHCIARREMPFRTGWPDRRALKTALISATALRASLQLPWQSLPAAKNTGLTVGTVMERSHTPLSVWFWAAYLVASQTPGMSAVQFQRQLGLSRYETAFQILHKLRAGMVRPNQDRIGGQPENHVEVDETWVGGRTRGEGRGVHHKVPVSCAIEVRHRKPGTKLDNRKDGRYAGRVRLAVVPDRSAESLCGFVESAVAPGSLIVTDDWSGYAGLGKHGYEHFAVAECGDPEIAEQYLPIIHLVFASLKWSCPGFVDGYGFGRAGGSWLLS